MLWAINQWLAHSLRHLQGMGSLPGDMAKLHLEAADKARQQSEEEMQAAVVAFETGRKQNSHEEEKQSWSALLSRIHQMPHPLCWTLRAASSFLLRKTGCWMRCRERRIGVCF